MDPAEGCRWYKDSSGVNTSSGDALLCCWVALHCVSLDSDELITQTSHLHAYTTCLFWFSLFHYVFILTVSHVFSQVSNSQNQLKLIKYKLVGTGSRTVKYDFSRKINSWLINEAPTFSASIMKRTLFIQSVLLVYFISSSVPWHKICCINSNLSNKE